MVISSTPPPVVSKASVLQRLELSNVVWDSPSADSSGTMPVGGGELCANVWVEPDGDIRLLLARTDAWSEISRLLKLGRVRIHLDLDPADARGKFKQTLDLATGRIIITRGDATITIVADSGSPAIWVTGSSRRPLKATVTLENWRQAPRTLPEPEQTSAWSMQGAPFPLVESADHYLEPGANDVIWMHRNQESCVPFTLQHQSLTGLPGSVDPVLNRTFGGMLRGTGFVKQGPDRLQMKSASARFCLQIATHSACSEDPAQWQEDLHKIAGDAPNPAQAAARSLAWWRQFWNRSWVFCGSAGPGQATNQAYALQRYVTACQGRGAFPIKFNGGLFTVEPTAMGRPFNPDWRSWGDSYWFQNTRFMYHPMLASGDFEMMNPFFRLYESARPLAEARTRAYHGASGCYFPETMTTYGTYANSDYGWNRTGLKASDVQCMYWRYAWNQGPELVALMLDYYDYTGDDHFLTTRALPMAASVLNYFHSRFARGSDGKLVISPAQAVETYWYDVKDDMPTVAGITAITQRLCALPHNTVTPAQRKLFDEMKGCVPELPVEEAKARGKKLSPAREYKNETSNCENPELYAVFPFRLSALGSSLLNEGRQAYAERKNHLDLGWGYDGNVAALLGLSEEAARILDTKVANSHPKYRFPATWGPNFDWLPDQNHGGNLLLTTQLMLLQASGSALRVLPAWPRDRDVHFKLHAPGNTTVELNYENGKIVDIRVTPQSRRKDVILPEGMVLDTRQKKQGSKK